MRIIFDLRSVGLGDNGGSSTIVKSSNTLVDMGHDVIIISTSRNQHTWESLKAKHIRPSTPKQIPNADAVIATGHKSTVRTANLPDRVGVKMVWIRAWETWQMPDNKIVEKVLNQPVIKLVNSICLQDKLKEHGFDSYIVRPGYDFDKLYPKNIRNQTEIVIGGLYRDGIHGRRKRTEWILEATKKIKDRYKNVRLWMFGSERNPSNPLIDTYIQKPSHEQKNNFYNRVDIWLAPTKSEGLHMPPAEAMLTECPVIGTNAPMAGTQDYLIHGETGLISKNRIDNFAKQAIRLIKNKNERIRLGKNAREKVLSLGDRKENMQKLVSLIERHKDV